MEGRNRKCVTTLTRSTRIGISGFHMRNKWINTVYQDRPGNSIVQEEVLLVVQERDNRLWNRNRLKLDHFPFLLLTTMTMVVMMHRLHTRN
jgi:hypothetical protein